MIAVEETFWFSWHHGPKPELTVDQREIAKVIAVAEAVSLLFIVRPSVFVPERIEGLKQWLGATEQQIAELRPALRVEADNLAVEDSPVKCQQ